MKITIQTPDIKARPDLLEFTERHVQKLANISDRVLEAQVVLTVDKSDTRENKVCEIRLAIPGNDLFAKKKAKTFEEGVTKTCEGLKKQVVAWKEKTRPF